MKINYVCITLLAFSIISVSLHSMQLEEPKNIAEANAVFVKRLFEALNPSNKNSQNAKDALKVLTNPKYPYLKELSMIELLSISAKSTAKEFRSERARLITQSYAVLKEQLGDETFNKPEIQQALVDLYSAGKLSLKKANKSIQAAI